MVLDIIAMITAYRAVPLGSIVRSTFAAVANAVKTARRDGCAIEKGTSVPYLITPRGTFSP